MKVVIDAKRQSETINDRMQIIYLEFKPIDLIEFNDVFLFHVSD